MPKYLEEHMGMVGDSAKEAGAAIWSIMKGIARLIFYGWSAVIGLVAVVPITLANVLWQILRKYAKEVDEDEG